MSKSAIIQTRVDPILKSNAQKILEKLNISMSEAISMYLSQIVLHNGIPFDVKIPDEVLAKVLKDSEKGKNLHYIDTGEDLLQELDD